MKVTQPGKRTIHCGLGALVTNQFLQRLYSTLRSGLNLQEISITGPKNMEGMTSSCIFHSSFVCLKNLLNFEVPMHIFYFFYQLLILLFAAHANHNREYVFLIFMFEEQQGDGRARGAVVGWAPQQFGAWHLPPPALMMPYCPSSSVSHPQSGRHPLPAVELYESPCPVIVCTMHECTLFVVLWEWQITSLWGETGL